jgi:hypothetical protein
MCSAEPNVQSPNRPVYGGGASLFAVSRTNSLAAVVGLTAVGYSLYRSARSTGTVPLSPLTAGRRVGADFVERTGVAGPSEPAGEMDDMETYRRPDFDPDRVHPAVRALYEETADHQMAYEATWHRPFRTGAALASGVTSRVEQLNLPAPDQSGGVLDSRLVEVDRAADGRDGARAWVRTDATTGRAVFVAVYASHRSDGVRYVNIAAPLPGGNLSTVLRIDHLRTDGRAGRVPAAPETTGVRLTTRVADADPGLYLVTPAGPFELPMDQTFDVRPAAWLSGSVRESFSPAERRLSGAPSVLATHEMWVAGAKFLTVRYACAPTAEA